MYVCIHNYYIYLYPVVYRWDAHEEVGFYSERVETLFRAVYNTSNEIAAKAAAVQKRNVIGHIAELVSSLSTAVSCEQLNGHADVMVMPLACSGRNW